MNKKSIILTFGLLMILSFTMPTAFVEEYNLDRNLPAQDNMFLSNEVHDNILIVNDTDFIAQAEDEVWPGEGTPSSPYYIEGYNISSDLTGIEIHNVSLYFVIQNCYIDSVSVTSNDGIYLKNVTHSEIRDTTVQDKINGISLVYSGNVLVSGFTVSYCFNGFHLFEANNSRIEYCEIFECEYGFRSFSSDNLAISNTDVHDNLYTAIDIMESDFAEITSCGSYDNGGIGIFVWSSQNITITENVAYRNGDLDTGVLLYLSDNATITGNELYDNQHVGIMLEYSNLAIIQDNHISNNSDMGIYLYDSNNCSIMNNEVWENGFWNLRSPVGGVVLDGSLHSVIQGNSIGNNSFAGIYLVETVDYGEITGNHIYNNTDHGIYGYDSNDFKVFNNDIWGNGWNSTSTYVGAISTSACQGWNISENTIWNNVHHGMYLYGNYFDIVGNRVYNNNESGITMIMSSYDSITGNIVHGQDVGISVYNQHTDVTHNIVFDNGYGIQTYSCTNVSLYYNDLAWNTVNAEEAFCFDVYWHDNQSIGNWWGDYNGAGSYGISNSTHIVNYDPYPRKSLDLNESAPVNFEITETGNTMSWGAYALHPSHYEVYANGTLLYSEEWAGSNIVTNLDGLLPAGTNEIMVIAYHISGHSVNAIAIATVTDTTAPEWTVAAQDQEITEGDPFSYQLSAEDPSGIAGYAVNDTLHFQIDSSGLLTNAIDLEAGVYWLTVTAWDQFGNTVEATFKVTVLPASSTGNGMVWILLALGGGVAALLVVVVLFIKKR